MQGVRMQGEGEELEEALDRAARAIAECDVLLFHFGAGMSVDSGLAAYKDVANVYQKLDMDYDDLCRPEHLESPAGVPLFFGFWGQCFNAYRTQRPHEGYAVCREWKQQAPECYVYTSNVDSFARVSGLAAGTGEGLYELHGCSEHWQCAKRCRQRLWRAPPDYLFDVDPETLLARPVAYRGPGGGAAAADELFESAEFSRRSFAAGPYPACPSCGAHARPAILMFDDFQCVENRPMACAYDAFCERVLGGEGQRCGRRVAIVEVGCGRTVPSVSSVMQCQVRVAILQLQIYYSSSHSLILYSLLCLCVVHRRTFCSWTWCGCTTTSRGAGRTPARGITFLPLSLPNVTLQRKRALLQMTISCKWSGVSQHLQIAAARPTTSGCGGVT